MTPPTLFHDGRVALYAGDCLDVLRRLEPNSIDAVVCDPPYHLTSIVKRFGGENAAPALSASQRRFKGSGGGDRQPGSDQHGRLSRGFMGQTWDGGDVAFRPETWIEVLRVLKPGGHLVAFSGSRTYHRMACAIEDAGFELRDLILDILSLDPLIAAFMASLDDEQLAAFVRIIDESQFGGMLAWVYGSGFPKSHAVDRGIDDHLFGQWLDADPARRSAYRDELRACDAFETREEKRKARADVESRWRRAGGFEAIIVAEGAPVRRMIPGADQNRAGWEKNDGATFVPTETVAATEEGRRWEGWATALKPAHEPIALARKPLSEKSVAANVLRWGTGAINIDACRIPGEKPDTTRGAGGQNGMYSPLGGQGRVIDDGRGRHPANLVHDGSRAVVEAFPNEAGAAAPVRGAEPSLAADGSTVYGRRDRVPGAFHADEGSAARFFYSSKAGRDDRLGAKHPTVKPVDLMRWLVRLVTPPGGTVLDHFAGTGTTGHAALLEGARAVLIEREPTYREDIARRMRLVFAGEVERKPIARKQEDAEALPLFSSGGLAP